MGAGRLLLRQLLYEMLTGRSPFKGDTAPEILASVLVREADLTLIVVQHFDEELKRLVPGN